MSLMTIMTTTTMMTTTSGVNVILPPLRRQTKIIELIGVTGP